MGAAVRVVQWAHEHGEVGGVTRAVHALTAALRGDGVRVDYLDTGSAARASRQARHLGGRHTVHCLHITRLDRAMALAPVLRRLPGPTVLVLHSGSVGRQVAMLSPGRLRLLSTALSAYDEIWAVSVAIRDVLPASIWSRVRVVSPYVPDELLTTLPARETHLVLVSTNANQPHYGADLAIDAVAMARDRETGLRLRILAYGSQGPAVDALRARVAGLGWADLTWNLDPAAVRTELARAAVLLRPTWWDGDSVIVREALAVGTRVLAAATSPRSAGVEVCGLSAEAFAAGILDGAPVSDGAGLAAGSILDEARRLIRATAGAEGPSVLG